MLSRDFTKNQYEHDEFCCEQATLCLKYIQALIKKNDPLNDNGILLLDNAFLIYYSIGEYIINHSYHALFETVRNQLLNFLSPKLSGNRNLDRSYYEAKLAYQRFTDCWEDMLTCFVDDDLPITHRHILTQKFNLMKEKFQTLRCEINISGADKSDQSKIGQNDDNSPASDNSEKNPSSAEEIIKREIDKLQKEECRHFKQLQCAFSDNWAIGSAKASLKSNLKPDSATYFNMLIEHLESEINLIKAGRFNGPGAMCTWQMILPAALSYPDTEYDFGEVAEDEYYDPQCFTELLQSGEEVHIKCYERPSCTAQSIRKVQAMTGIYLGLAFDLARTTNSKSEELWAKAIGYFKRVNGAFKSPKNINIIDKMAETITEAASRLEIDLSVNNTPTKNHRSKKAKPSHCDAIAHQVSAHKTNSGNSRSKNIDIEFFGVKIDSDGITLRLGKAGQFIFKGKKQWEIIDKLVDAWHNNFAKAKIGAKTELNNIFTSKDGRRLMKLIHFETYSEAKINSPGRNAKYTGFAYFIRERIQIQPKS